MSTTPNEAARQGGTIPGESSQDCRKITTEAAGWQDDCSDRLLQMVGNLESCLEGRALSLLYRTADDAVAFDLIHSTPYAMPANRDAADRFMRAWAHAHRRGGTLGDASAMLNTYEDELIRYGENLIDGISTAERALHRVVSAYWKGLTHV